MEDELRPKDVLYQGLYWNYSVLSEVTSGRQIFMTDEHEQISTENNFGSYSSGRFIKLFRWNWHEYRPIDQQVDICS